MEKAKISPSAPLKMSQVSPKVTHPQGEEEADSDRRLLSISLNTHPSPPPMSGWPERGTAGRWGDRWYQRGVASTHLPYLLEVELGKCMQPVGQLAQVEELHLEAGDKGASHPEGWREAPARAGGGRLCEELG